MLKPFLAFALVLLCATVSSLTAGFPPALAVCGMAAIGAIVFGFAGVRAVARRRAHAHLIPATPRSYRARRA